MSLENALKFIDKVRYDTGFRKAGYRADTPETFRRWIADSGYEIHCGEIWDAFRKMLLAAKDETEADEVTELKLWYTAQSAEDESCQNCNSCSTKRECELAPI